MAQAFVGSNPTPRTILPVNIQALKRSIRRKMVSQEIKERTVYVLPSLLRDCSGLEGKG